MDYLFLFALCFFVGIAATLVTQFALWVVDLAIERKRKK